MKKYVVALAVTISVCTQVALANTDQQSVNPVQQGLYQNRTVHDPIPANSKGDKVSGHIKAAFQKDFAGASVIKWERLKHEISQVFFNYNNERLIAFYDADAKLVATSRNIVEANLPLIVRQQVNRKYPSSYVVQATELMQDDETSYLLVLENEQGERVQAQAYYNGSVYTLKKEKKKNAATL